jgi:hypothetical protein
MNGVDVQILTSSIKVEAESGTRFDRGAWQYLLRKKARGGDNIAFIILHCSHEQVLRLVVINPRDGRPHFHF